ncbi:MAG: hypothetical protein GVY36_10355 [Verrucomicrobia bacterium]|jgi:hypothetical protein|nr:hypothetical protein [Verrucomicrobiota bacterium]
MPDAQASKSNFVLTFLGGVGAILIFLLILFIAYLPNRPDRVDADAVAERQAKADEARAAGIQKITTLEVIDADAGISRIPVSDAMQRIVSEYRSETSDAE